MSNKYIFIGNILSLESEKAGYNLFSLRKFFKIWICKWINEIQIKRKHY